MIWQKSRMLSTKTCLVVQSVSQTLNQTRLALCIIAQGGSFVENARKLHFRLTYGAWLSSVIGSLSLLIKAFQAWSQFIAAASWLITLVLLTAAVYVQLRIERYDRTHKESE